MLQSHVGQSCQNIYTIFVHWRGKNRNGATAGIWKVREDQRSNKGKKKHRPLQSFQNIDLFFWTDHKLVQNVQLSLCWKNYKWVTKVWLIYDSSSLLYNVFHKLLFLAVQKTISFIFFRYFLSFLIHRTFGSVHNFGYQTRWVIQVRIRNQNFNGHWQSIKCKISNYIWKWFIYLCRDYSSMWYRLTLWKEVVGCFCHFL